MALTSTTTAIPRRPRRSEAPLSFAQQGLWFLEQLAPGSPRYNVPLAVRLAGPLDAGALARAVRLVVERHDALRTTFVERRGEPVQVVAPASACRLRQVDLTSVAAGARASLARRLLRRDVWRPFDLARGPLLRVTLWREAAESHVLSLTLHHIVADAASLDVMLREVTAAYAAGLAGRAPELPALELQYGDYAAWERERAQGPVFEPTLAYWQERLAGLPPLDLAADRPRPAARTFAGGAQPWSLSRELSAAVRALARRERVTLFTLLLAAFALLLRRHTRPGPLAIGTPMTLRTGATEGLVGLFLNTLVLRLDPRGAQPFTRFLADARDVLRAAFAHREVPFERVVERLRPARRDDTPLVEVMLAAQAPPREHAVAPGLSLQAVPIADEAVRFDLTLFVLEGDELSGVLAYARELFEPATAARLCAGFTRLLDALVARPEATLDEILRLDAAERAEVLARGRGQTREPAPVSGVHELIERQADQAPAATAVWRDGRESSYADLERDANRVAHALLELGAGRGARVAVCLDRRPPLVVALVGAMKAGACYVPLDPTYPPARLRHIVEDSRPAVLLTERRYGALWEGLAGVQVVEWEAEEERFARQPQSRPAVALTPEDPVYVVYTSGSTGTPKGVIVPHRALLNSCLAVVEADGIERGDRFLHFAPIGFDVSAFQIFPALISGATVVLADPAGELSNDDILDLCEQARLTVLDLPSAMWQQWIGDLAERRRPLPPALRTYMTGGEATPLESVRAWSARVGGDTRFVSSYGPTETAVATMWRRRAREAAASPGAVVTLGDPLDNVSLTVLDDALQLVPPGVPGELCIAGAGLAHGYVGRPDLTAERFVPDPFGGRPGARLYRSGDRVRYGPDGALAFLGRLDQQLKLHGVRIEAGEVEAVLRRHPGVRAAAVTALARPDGRQALAAYVVPAAAAPAESELRAHLAAHLPPAVRPASIVFLEALPITANGKLDRGALPAPAPDDAERVLSAPRTQTERLLLEVWSAVLGTAAIGVDDDFFALGGHSLAAARLASRVREAFGVELGVRAVFEQPTLASLARRIDAGRRGATRPALARAERAASMPMSFAQRGFWLLDQLDPDRSLYANSEVLRVHGRFSPEAFAAALSTLVARHEVLRTTFRAQDGEPRQWVGPARPVRVPLVDLVGLAPGRREAAAAVAARALARAGFDLSRGPLLRSAVVRLADDQHVVSFTLHHMVSDLWSLSVLMAEFEEGYRAALERRAPALPELPVQYADYAAWEARVWSETALQAAAARRREQIGEIVELALPTDRPRGAARRFVAGRCAITLPAALQARLRAAGPREGATVFMWLLAGVQALLHIYTGQTTVLVASPVANRDEPALAGLIGYFVNHVVLAARFDGRPTCREVLARVRAASLDALDLQDLPFEEFVRRVRPDRQGSHTPLHRVLFNFVNAPRLRLDLPGARVELDTPPAQAAAKYELHWVFVDTGDALTGLLEYDRGLFDARSAARMADDCVRLLEVFVDAPDRTLDGLDLMTAGQESLALAFNEPL